MKLVINVDFGGFSNPISSDYDIDRKDPLLIAAVENGFNNDGELMVIDIEEKYFSIEEYDGLETVITSNSPLFYYRSNKKIELKGEK